MKNGLESETHSAFPRQRNHSDEQRYTQSHDEDVSDVHLLFA